MMLIEVNNLEALEAEIEEGFRLIYQGGAQLQRAIAEIRDKRLWRDVEDGFGNPVYASFEHYCRSRWYSARQTMDEHALAGQVANEMLALGLPEAKLPRRTSQLLALKKVEPDQRLAVLETATEIGGGKPTALSIKKVASQLVKPEIGEAYRVDSPSNLHHGKTIMVSDVKSGNIAIGPGGFPFLPGELAPVNPVEVATRISKPSLRDRVEVYRGLLTQVLEHEIDEALRGEIEAALG
ncbi:MAG: hypothetical protein F6K42_26000 [Leptolyngbya sp. SIO1D8]|nr:hypothetical protein [Leptolyngbya sp. SIO1D8]